MSLVSNNIKFLRKQLHLTQEQLAEKIGIKRSLIGAYEEGRADPRLSNLLKMSEIFKVSVDALISMDISEKGARKGTDWMTEIKTRILSITVDPEGRENIEMIPQKAAAGYLNGYADPEYLEELPKFRLPLLASSGTYRAFEISGDSMLPLEEGTVIIGKYTESVNDLKNNKTYILLTSSEGIVYKRIQLDHLRDGKLILLSDNTHYKPYEVEVNNIVEIWEAVMYISGNFPESPFTGERIQLEELKNIVLDLQQEMIKLKKN